MGNGYPKFASAQIAKAHPETEFEFINFGISGNRTSQVFDRLYADGIAFQPDIFSILIGINDIWHRYGATPISTYDEQFALNYRMILKEVREKTNAKIIMLQPFLLDAPEKAHMRADLDKILPIVDALAEEFADVYVRLDEAFAEALKTQPEPKFYSADGVHPNQNGAAFIGNLYAEAVEKLLK